MIDEAKFNQLEDATLPGLFRSGALGLAYLHLASMGNMRKLLDRVSLRSATKPAVEQAAKQVAKQDVQAKPSSKK